MNPDLDRPAVLFDLDGTLIDLRELHFRALNLALYEAGYATVTLEQHAAIDGLPTTVKLERLGIPDQIRPVVNSLKQQHTRNLLKESCAPNDRLNNELERIGREFFIGVVSNALNETCAAALMMSGIAPYVKLLIAGPHSRPKPDPEPYVKAIEAAHLRPDKTVAVEDNHFGAEAAQARPLRCLRVASPDDVTYDFVVGGFA